VFTRHAVLCMTFHQNPAVPLGQPDFFIVNPKTLGYIDEAGRRFLSLERKWLGRRVRFMPETISKDERTWGMLAHLSAFAGFIVPFGNVIGPLFVWLIKKDDYPFVNDQGKESLNFQITMTIFITVAIIFVFVLIGIPFLVALMLLDFVLVVVATIKANEGRQYRYPVNIRFIK
jgi:hypothetical protein